MIGPFLRDAVAHHGLIVRGIYHNILVPVQVDHETGTIYRDPKTGFAKRVSYDEGMVSSLMEQRPVSVLTNMPKVVKSS